jgi:hypothetical protein
MVGTAQERLCPPYAAQPIERSDQSSKRSFASSAARAQHIPSPTLVKKEIL